MILVTLGTQDKPFTRLLEAVERAIEKGLIKDRVVVQAGYTKFESKNMEIFDYIEEEQFASYLQQADLIITHGGVGTIMTALKASKPILAAARLAQYKEHHNDHQVQLLEAFEEKGYLIYMKDLEDLTPYFEKLQTFVPKKYESNHARMIGMLKDWMEKN